MSNTDRLLVFANATTLSPTDLVRIYKSCCLKTLSCRPVHPTWRLHWWSVGGAVMEVSLQVIVVACVCSTVALQAEVQRPDVCLFACEITLSKVFIGVPTYHQVTLINKTLLATEFEWGQVRHK